MKKVQGASKENAERLVMLYVSKHKEKILHKFLYGKRCIHSIFLNFAAENIIPNVRRIEDCAVFCILQILKPKIYFLSIQHLSLQVSMRNSLHSALNNFNGSFKNQF